MIFYFSGTGNSRHVAEVLAGGLGETLIPISASLKNETGCRDVTPAPGESIGWVFPVYAWGPPPVVVDFIQKLQFKLSASPYVFFVCTCGDDVGRTDRIFARLLKTKNLRLNAGFSLQMPNTYVCLPGFDVDSEETAAQKKRETEALLPRLVEALRRKEETLRVTPGSFPWFKSHVLRPLFNRFLLTDRYFSVSPDCISCNRCAQTCPVGNIRLTEGHPVWQGACAGCLACYHACPVHAIHFGKATKNKGQYRYQ